MSRVRLVLVTAIVVLVVIVVAQNTEAVETEILFVTVRMPRAMLLLVTLLIGFAIGVLASGSIRRRGRKQNQ